MISHSARFLLAGGLFGLAFVSPAFPDEGAFMSYSALLPFPGSPDSLESVVAGAALPGAMPIGLLPPIVKNGTPPTITTQPASQSATSGSSVTLSVVATGTPTPIYQWMKNGRFISGANAASYTISSVAPGNAGAYTVEVYNGAGFATSQPALLSVSNAGVITAAPQSLSIATGATAGFSVTAAGAGLTYQWQFDGINIPGATSASYSLANAGPGASGNFSVIVSSGATVVAEEVASLKVTTNARLTNLSTRGVVGTGEQALFVGFVANGTGTKEVLLRGIGPTLASQFGVSGALAAPELTLYGSNGQVIATNSGWGGTAALTQAFAQVGAFPLPANSADAALLQAVPVGPVAVPASGSIPASTTNAGAYSAQVSGINGASGIALAELYDADTGTPATSLVNISARAYVANGASVLIAGFVVTGPSSETILIRGVGPSLQRFGVFNYLKNTQISLFDSAGNPITAKSGWGNDPWITATGSQVGAFPLTAGSLDSALLVTVPPGMYSAQVSSTDGSTGVGMVEIYEVR